MVESFQLEEYTILDMSMYTCHAAVKFIYQVLAF